MRRHLESGRPKTLVAALAITLSCIWSLNLARDVYDTSKVRNMTRQMKTICVGRFLIDLPAGAQVRFGEAFLSGLDMSSSPHETDEQFSKRLEKTEAELRTKDRKGRNGLELAKVIDQNGLHGKMFVFGRVSDTGVMDGEPYNWVNVAVRGLVRANGVSFNFNTNLIDPAHIPSISQLISQIKPLAEGEISREPGFCINRGLIRDPLTADQRERTTLFVGIADHPDIAIVLDTAAGLKPGDSMLARDDNNSIRQEYASHFHIFRRGAKTLAGIPGEELLERVSEPNGTTGHSFAWELFGKKDDVFKPSVSLELGSGYGRRAGGKPVNSTLRDDAILALWDKISSSLRVRPTEAPPAIRTNAAAPR